MELQRVTITRTDYIDLDELAVKVEHAILEEMYSDALSLSDIIRNVINDCFIEYDVFDEEIEEFNSIFRYVKGSLSVEALARL